MYDYTWFNYSFQRSTMKSQVIYCRELRYQYNYSSRYFCWRAWPFYIIRSALKLLFTNTKIHENKICLGIQKEQHIFLVTCKISQEKILWCAAEIQNVNETYTTNYMLYIRLIRGFKKKKQLTLERFEPLERIMLILEILLSYQIFWSKRLESIIN